METGFRKPKEEFQLTTSHRGRLNVAFILPLVSYFNSLPHTEVDVRLLQAVRG